MASMIACLLFAALTLGAPIFALMMRLLFSTACSRSSSAVGESSAAVLNPT